MFWDRLRVIFARSVKRGIKWLWEALLNIIMPKNVALLLSISRELNQMKKKQTTIHFERLRERARGRKHILPRQISILTRAIHYNSQQRDGN